MVSLKNPIIIKKVVYMKNNNRKEREQKAWQRNQAILALRKESEENKKSFSIVLQARKRHCR